MNQPVPDAPSGNPGLNAPHGAHAIEHLPMERVNPPEPFFRGFGRTAREVWTYRELLLNLTRKELKVKYKDSVLGFLWSLARPMVTLAIYYVAIGKFLGAGIPSFPIYLFTGLIAWSLFTDIIASCTGTIVANGGLIKKVYFPREILPLSAVGAALVHFCMQLLVLFAAMLIARYDFFGWNLLLIVPALFVLLLLATGGGLMLSAANVYLRDTQHLIELVLLFLFWMSPIVYPVTYVTERLSGGLLRLYLANPMTNVVMGFQRATYKHIVVDGRQVLFGGDILLRLLVLTAFGLVFLWFGQRVFARAQGNFAQEL